MDPISAGISGLGKLFNGVSGFFMHQAQAKALKQAAQQTLAEAGVNAQTALQEGDAVAAQGAAQVAANGGGFVGSSIGVLQNLASQAMFNARAQVYRGETAAQDLKYRASVEHHNAWNTLVSNTIEAGSSLLGGMAKGKLNAQSMKALGDLGGGADTVAGGAGGADAVPF